MAWASCTEAAARTRERCAQVRCAEIAAVVREGCTNTCVGASRIPAKCASVCMDADSGLRSKRKRIFEGIEPEPNESMLQTYKEQYYLHGDEYASRGIAQEVSLNPVTESLTYLRKQRELLKNGMGGTVETESRFKAWVDKDELHNLLMEEREQKVMRKWLRFDSFFGALVCLNGFVMGLTADGVLNETSVQYKIFDYCFFVWFSVEWCIRWRYKKNGLQGMLTDPWTVLDLVILVINALDNILLLTAQRSGVAKLFTMMRVLRLLRLVRLVRLVKLLEELWFLLNGVFHAMRILAWALGMFVALSYISGLLFYTIFQMNPTDDDANEHKRLWGTLERIWLTLAQVATYSGISVLEDVVEQTVLGPFILVLVLAFIFVASLGVMNLCIGVLLTTALKLANTHESFASSTRRLCLHRTVRALREVLVMKCNSALGETATRPQVTKEMLLKWVNDEEPVSLFTQRFDVRNTTASSTTLDMDKRASGDMDKRASGEKIQKLSSQKSTGGEKIQKLSSQKSTVTIVSELESMVTGHKPKSGLARSFDDAKVNEDVIELIFNESKTVFGGEEPVCLDDFIEACIWVKEGTVHPLDVFYILTGLRDVYERLTYVEGVTASTLHTLQETSERCRVLLEKYHSEKGKDCNDELLHSHRTHPGSDADRDREEQEETAANMQKKLMLLSQQEANLSREAMDFQIEQKIWTNFDLVFSLVVLVNAILFGIEVFYEQDKVRDFNSPAWDTTSMIWFLVDQAFITIYSFELGLRAIFYYQMRINRDFRVAGGVLPRLLINMRWPTQLQVIRMSPRWVKDTRNLLWLDILIVVISLIDNFILRSIQGGADYSKFLRTIGLLRISRLARLMHLIRPLHVLVRGFMGNVKLIFWSAIVLITFLYAGAVTIVLSLYDKKDEEHIKFLADHEQIRLYWGSFGSAMLTLAKIVTYDAWGQRLDELGQYNRMYYVFGLGFMAVTSLVVFNLITGVMVQAAFQIVSEENVKAMDLNMSMTKIALHDAMSRTYHNIEKRIARERCTVREHIKMMCEAVKNEFERFKMEEEEARKNKMPEDDSNLKDDGYLLEEESTCDVIEEYIGSSAEVKCVYDEHNYCTVVHATWCSFNEVAIGFETKHETDYSAEGGPLRDPMLSVLIWDGGRANPAMFVPETQVVSRAAFFTQEEDLEDDPEEAAKMIETLHEEIKRTTTNHSKGDLLFTDVPRYTKLRFRFGGNYSVAPLSIDCPPGLEEKIDVDLSQLYAVDPEVVGLRELQFLLQDNALMHRLASINVGPIQALMVYQALNVTGTATVKLSDFIDGLIRARRPEMGIDAAGAKAFMRRLLTEQEKLAKDASDCNACFAQVVANLRRVKVVQSEEFQLGTSLGEEHILEKEEDYVSAIEHLRMRNTKLHKLLRNRRRALKVPGPPVSGVDDMEAVTDPLISARTCRSITSARPGWD